jgi:hypothetical protein
VVKKEDVSHSLVSLKKKRLQRLEARGKRRAIETMTGPPTISPKGRDRPIAESLIKKQQAPDAN